MLVNSAQEMNGRETSKLSSRDLAKLKALQEADKALEQLWKHCEIGSWESLEVSRMQKVVIHPAIRQLTQHSISA